MKLPVLAVALVAMASLAWRAHHPAPDAPYLRPVAPALAKADDSRSAAEPARDLSPTAARPAIEHSSRAIGETIHDPQSDVPALRSAIPAKTKAGFDEPRLAQGIAADEIVFHVTEIANYEASELWSFGDLETFYERFMSLSTNSGEARLNASGMPPAQIEFSDSNLWKMGEDRSRLVFEPGTTKIYAVLPQVDAPGDEVLVRWYATGDPDLILFQKYATPASSGKNHIWLEYPQGWRPGSYQVEVFSEDEYIDLLARGQYEIAQPVN